MKELPGVLLDILKAKDATPFQIEIYKAVFDIPWGETRSYKWVAGKAKRYGSSRAVGQALKKNPLPFIIPCHRVIKADGTLGGFWAGRGLKKRLLGIERLGIMKKRGRYV